jgi:hypothetical protein
MQGKDISCRLEAVQMQSDSRDNIYRPVQRCKEFWSVQSIQVPSPCQLQKHANIIVDVWIRKF